MPGGELAFTIQACCTTAWLSFRTVLCSKSGRAGVLGFGLSTIIFAAVFFATRSKEHGHSHTDDKDAEEDDETTTTHRPRSVGKRIGITALVVIPIAILMAIVYVGYERGWWIRIWRYFCGSGRWTILSDNQPGGPRGTIRASIELTENFGRLFGEDGKLVSKLVSEEIEEDQEQQRLQKDLEELTKQAAELEAYRRKMGGAQGQDAAKEKELEVKQKEIEKQAENIRTEMELKPEERWNISGGAYVDDDGEVEDEEESAQSVKAKRAQRHGFATQDTEKAQAAAKARVEKKENQTDGENANEQEKLVVKLKRVDGKDTGLKYGPGLFVVSIQADSLVAEWNAKNAAYPKNIVREGDKVVSVNGITGNGEMLKLLRSKDEGDIEIVFQPKLGS